MPWKQIENPKLIFVFFEAFCYLQTYYKMPTRTKEPFTDMALTKDGILVKVWVKGALGCQKFGRVFDRAVGVYF